jgi:hypothetical protein
LVAPPAHVFEKFFRVADTLRRKAWQQNVQPDVKISTSEYCNFCTHYITVLLNKLILRTFENGMLRAIFGLKWKQLTARWGKSHVEKLLK